MMVTDSTPGKIAQLAHQVHDRRHCPAGSDCDVGFDSEDDEAVDLHSQRSVFEIAQGANQQSCAHQQHHAQRHLQSDDDSCRCAICRHRCSTLRLRFSGRVRPAGKRDAQRRQPKQQRGNHQDAER